MLRYPSLFSFYVCVACNVVCFVAYQVCYRHAFRSEEMSHSILRYKARERDITWMSAYCRGYAVCQSILLNIV